MASWRSSRQPSTSGDAVKDENPGDGSQPVRDEENARAPLGLDALPRDLDPLFSEVKAYQEQLEIYERQVVAGFAESWEQRRAARRVNEALASACASLERVRSAALDANPLTGLPGANAADRAIAGAMEAEDPRVVVLAELSHFSGYNKAYGAARGDAVIRFVATSLEEVLVAGLDAQAAAAPPFLAHFGGDDFLFIAPAAQAEALADRAATVVNAGVRAHYERADVDRGYVIVTDRRGDEQRHPIIRLSLAGVDLSRRAYERVFEVREACSQVSRLAKLQASPDLIMDRRR